MVETLILSFIIMLASLSGVIFIWKNLGDFIERNLSFLVSFSAGVFLFVTYSLAEESVHKSEDLFSGLIWIVIGVAIFYILFKLLPQFHHHHDEKEEKDCPHSHIDARRVLLSDGIHNIGDGILLATSTIVSPALGVVTAISIFVHEFVQEISEFFVLKQSGYSAKKALSLNFLVSGTILIGAIGSFLLIDSFRVLEIPLLGIAAGSFLVVVINDLIPHSIRNSKNKTHYIKHITWFMLGLLIMFLVGSSFSHEHEEEHIEDIHSEEIQIIG